MRERTLYGYEEATDKKMKKKLKPRTKLDMLIQDRMGQGFILSFTSDLKSLDKADLAQKKIIDGYRSVEPMALAFTVIMNAVITQRRLFFAFLKEDFYHLIKQDDILRKVCSRRKRQSVMRVDYATFRSIFHKSEIFKQYEVQKTNKGNDIVIFELIDPQLREYVQSKGADSENQLVEIRNFYDRSRKKKEQEVQAALQHEMRAAEKKAKREQSQSIEEKNKLL